MFQFYIFVLIVLSSIRTTVNGNIADKEFLKVDHCTDQDCPSSEFDGEIRTSNCDRRQSIAEFKQKRLSTPIQLLDYDPYSKEFEKDEERIMRSVIENGRINCGVKYVDEAKTVYELRTFPNEYETLQAGFVITHFGRCGACSSLKDLSVYLEFNKNLTLLARQCFLLAVVAHRLSSYCYDRIGFTEPCSQIWLYSAMNTRSHCWWPCLKSWLFNDSPNYGDGEDRTLNACLQCDEDHSGFIFKFYAGRTRSNSGIVTDVWRRKGEVRNLVHCYY